MKNLTQRQLRDVLTDSLHLQDPEFHLENWGNRISGSVVSATFRGMRDSERQKKIWDALENRFHEESPLLVGMLLAFTPEEWNIQLEGHTNGRRKHRKNPTR